MRIIHLALGKANPERMNGVNKVVHGLATHQARLGHEVEVWGITPTPGDAPADREYPLRLFRIPRNRFARPAGFDAAVAALPRGAVFHLHGGFIPQFAAAAALLRREGIPYLFTPHGAYGVLAMRKSPIAKRAYTLLFERALIRGAFRVHSVAGTDLDGMRARIPEDKAVVIPNGQDLDVDRAPFNPEAKPAEPVFGFCGRIDIHTKGLDVLFAAFALHRAAGLPGVLWIVGDGPEMPKLKALAAELGITGGIRFFGSRFGAAKLGTLRAMDAFVHPSRNEGLPMSVLEAGALGLCLVVSEGTNMAAYVRRYEAGFALPENTPEGLARAFAAVAAERASGRLAGYGRNARRMVESEFDWGKIASRLAEVCRLAAGTLPRDVNIPI